MSLRQLTSEIDRIVVGVEVQEAVDKVVDYIRKKHKFKSVHAAQIYWDALFDDEKVDVLTKALRS